MSDAEGLELIALGHDAYQLGDYIGAARLLALGLDVDPENWHARLYLAMAYYRIGQTVLSRQEFKRIMDCCADTDLRQKAAAAFGLMGSQGNKR